MKIVATADWHIRAKNPRIRNDEYAMTQYRKIKWILDLAEKKGADVAVAGDIFDAPRCPYWLLVMYIDLFKRFHKKIYVVPGQHDLHFHNPDLANTPLGALLSAKIVEIPNNKGVRGVGWEEELPEKGSHVLLWHFPVTPEEPPFFMEDAVSAEDMMDQLESKGYGLIITGDYHVAHCTLSEHCILVNPGPIMRSSKDKIDYIPKVFFYDNGMIEEYEIPIEKDVFDLEKLEQDDRKEFSDDLKELIESFSEETKFLNYWEVVQNVAKKAKTSKDATIVLKQVEESYNGKGS